jgi:uncharacterized membrane protein
MFIYYYFFKKKHKQRIMLERKYFCQRDVDKSSITFTWKNIVSSTTDLLALTSALTNWANFLKEKKHSWYVTLKKILLPPEPATSWIRPTH